MNFDSIVRDGSTVQSAYNKKVNAIKNRLASRPNDEDAKQLQKILQNKMYGDKKYAENLLKAVKEVFISTDKNLQKSLEAWTGFNSIAWGDFDTQITNEETKAQITKFISTQRAKFNTASTSIAGLKNKKKEMENAINHFNNQMQISSNSVQNEMYMKAITDMQVAIKQVNDIVVKYTGIAPSETTQLVFDEYDISLEDTVNSINSIYFNYILPYEVARITPVQIGDILEYSLGIISKQGVHEIQQQYVYSMLNDIVTGKKTTAKKSNSGIITNISMENKDIKKITSTKDNFEINIDGIKIAVGKNNFQNFNPYTSRQQKTDVTFQYPIYDNQNMKFQISAKNWDLINSQRGFETTNLAYSMYRIFDEDTFADYSFVFTNKRNNSIYDAAHKLAYLSVLADALIGFGQSDQEMADTLVINDRQNSQIIVASMQHIANNIDDIMMRSKNAFSGYNKSSIENDVYTIYSKKRSKMSLAFAYIRAYIAQQKVMLKFSALQEYSHSKKT